MTLQVGAPPAHDEQASTQPDPSALCLRCGLCCDGTFFYHVELSREEVPLARELGLHVIENELRQPCTAHRSDGTCAIYRHRPSGCVKFECRLLKRYLAEELTFVECTLRVERIKELVSALIARLSPDRPGLRRALTEHFARTRDTRDWRLRNAGLLLDVASFDRYGRDDFGAGFP